MKMKCILFKVRFFYLAIVFCCLSGSVTSLQAREVQDTIPSSLLGNWINSSSHDWEYGFFEHFAIYDTDFWKYKAIKQTRKQILIQLEREGKQVDVRVRKGKDGKLQIAYNKEAFQLYQPGKKGFLPYPEKDTTRIAATPRFVTDTVTLLGYYRNIDRLPKGKQRKVVTVLVNDFLLDDQKSFFSDIDSLGRFCVKIPMSTMGEIAIDWGFLSKKINVEPGEKVFLYADAEDLFSKNRGATREEYWTQERNALFMGKQARFHNEMAYCPMVLGMRNYSDLDKLVSSDMELLKLAEGDYLNEVKNFKLYQQKYPTLSQKCISVSEFNLLYELAYNLMQHRFNIRRKGRLAFDDPGYMEYVKRTIPLDREWYYMQNRSFSTFIRDYIGYMDDQRGIMHPQGFTFYPSLVQPLDVLTKMAEKGLIASDDLPLIEQQKQINEQLNALLVKHDTLTYHKLQKEDQLISDKLDKYSMSEKGEALRELMTMERKYTFYDTIAGHKLLTELLFSRFYMKELEQKRAPFSTDIMALLDQKVTTSWLKQQVLDRNNYYQKIVNKEITYLESLKSGEHLKDFKDAKALLNQLIAPFKGRVVYLDIWGTWCGPCCEQMKYATAVKEALKDKPVIFLYLANRSDEKTWKNIIKEYNLTGENVVHYRLPEEQQSMLERLLNIHFFPTYILLDQHGNIVNPNAPKPQAMDVLLKEINALLKK